MPDCVGAAFVGPLSRHIIYIMHPSADASGLLRLSHDCKSWCFDKAAFIAKRTEHSGVGLYAARKIHAGERLLAEVPLAVWRVASDASNHEKLKSFEANVASLPPSAIEQILHHSCSPKYGKQQRLLGTWQTNGLPINYESDIAPGTTNRELMSKKEAAVFPTICRLNHSCQPNCHHSWNGRIGKETVHAIVDIAAGEALTICYLAPRGLERQHRRAKLLEEHGFECRCCKCDLADEALALSEARQRESQPATWQAVPLAQPVLASYSEPLLRIVDAPLACASCLRCALACAVLLLALCSRAEAPRSSCVASPAQAPLGSSSDRPRPSCPWPRSSSASTFASSSGARKACRPCGHGSRASTRLRVPRWRSSGESRRRPTGGARWRGPLVRAR